MKVPLTKPFFDFREEEAVINVLRSGWHSQGPQTEALENEFSNLVGSKYAVAVSSCTSALHISLILLDVGEGDEVLVPSFTYIASANVVRYVGATPVFCEVDEKTFNIDPKDMEKKITNKTKAIVAVDQVGMPCNYDQINKIAKKYHLKVLEDAACAIGSEYKGKKVGSLSKITCFSFHPRKIISSGEGGIITTNDHKLANLAKELRSHGATFSAYKRHSSSRISFESYTRLGYNFRLTDIQAAIIRQQIKKLPKILKKRESLAKRYTQKLKNLANIETPFTPNYAKPNWQSYIVKLTSQRNKQLGIMQKLLNKGIITRKGVMASHLEPYYTKLFGKKLLPVTESLAKSTFTLPLFPEMTVKEQDYVIYNLRKIL